ncbi:MAG: hypothetical protein ACE5E6_06650, partial [Phycisphaerae bacterium]
DLNPGDALAVSPSAPSACSWGAYVIQRLLDQARVIITHTDGFLQTAEAVLMGLPGPLRAATSVAAGLSFSLGRCHALNLLSGDTAKIKARIAGQPIELIDADTAPAPDEPRSGWIDFAERLLSKNDIQTLARRTSRPFRDCSHEALHRIGQLYLAIDDAASVDTDALLAQAARHVQTPADDADADIVREWLEVVRTHLVPRFATPGHVVPELRWNMLAGVWSGSPRGTDFAQPCVDAVLRMLAASDPVAAARLAAGVARNIPDRASQLGHDALLDHVLKHFAVWCEHQTDDAVLADARPVADTWRSIRPGDPFVLRALECVTPQPAAATNDHDDPSR